MDPKLLNVVDNTLVTDGEFVTQEDQNNLQVTILEIQNLELQGRIMQQQLMELAKVMAEKQKILREKSEVMNKKYGITMGKDKIGPDGRIVRGG
jgi:hypothetical protein